MSIYTKTGDDGTTSLIGGKRVNKYDLRLEAYGTVDELTAFIALLRDSATVRNLKSEVINDELIRLLAILDRLMVVQALLASENDTIKKLPQINEEDINDLEKAIDQMTLYLPKISKFTLPCGDTLVSTCHICRTICRRAERVSIHVASDGYVPSTALKYLNRLSDYLYSLARLFAIETSAMEILWEPKK